MTSPKQRTVFDWLDTIRARPDMCFGEHGLRTACSLDREPLPEEDPAFDRLTMEEG
jgi:hypothetical protein